MRHCGEGGDCCNGNLFLTSDLTERRLKRMPAGHKSGKMRDLKGLHPKMTMGSWLVVLWTILLVWIQHSPVFGQEDAVVKRSESSVVIIRFYDDEGEILHQGNGFYINRGGDVITRFSLLKGVRKADVRTNDGMLYPVEEVISEDREVSLVRVSVQIPSRLVHPLPVSVSLPRMGEPVLAIGHSSGAAKPVAYGLVSAFREIPGFGKVIQVTPNLPLAADGSPVINLKGEMVGVAIVELVEGRNLHFIIPGETIMKDLPPEKGIPLAEWEANRVETAGESYARGLPFLWKEEYEKALPYFLEAVKKDPRDAKAYFQIGYCNAQLGVYKEAVKAYERAIALKPDFVMAHLFLGLTYIQLRDREAALKEYRALNDLHRGYAKDLLNMIQ
jgi:hypothetical protein